MRVALHLILIYLFNQPRHVGYRLKIKDEIKDENFSCFQFKPTKTKHVCVKDLFLCKKTK